MTAAAIVYVVGAMLGLMCGDARFPHRIALAVLWPVGLVAFAVTLAVLCGAAVIAFPLFAGALLAASVTLWALFG